MEEEEDMEEEVEEIMEEEEVAMTITRPEEVDHLHQVMTAILRVEMDMEEIVEPPLEVTVLVLLLHLCPLEVILLLRVPDATPVPDQPRGVLTAGVPQENIQTPRGAVEVMEEVQITMAPPEQEEEVLA